MVTRKVADAGLLLSVTSNWCPSQWLPFVPQLRFKITTSRRKKYCQCHLGVILSISALFRLLSSHQLTSGCQPKVPYWTNEIQIFGPRVGDIYCSNAMNMRLRFTFFNLPQHRAETHCHIGSKIKYTFIQATLRWPDVFSPISPTVFASLSSTRYLSAPIGYTHLLFIILLGTIYKCAM